MIAVQRTDITKLAVDAIVNAANEWLLGGGGVDGAIHRAAGPDLLAECRELPEVRPGVRCPTGEARMTGGHRLAARHVIHTVGPVYGQEGGAEPQLLANCYRHALELAREHGLATVAFPAISTGVFGYPAAEAAKVVSRTLADFLADDRALAEVRMVFFSRRQAEEFVTAAGFDCEPG